MNKVILIGRLTKDPEVGATGQGLSVGKFTLAVSRQYKQNNEEITDFINIVVWRSLADLCGQYLHKGSQCAVVGNMQNRSYEKNGEKRYITEVVADTVEFLGSRQNSETKQEKIEDLQPIETPFDNGKLPF